MWAEFTYDAYGLPQLHVPGAPDNTIAQAVQASIGLMLTPQLYRGYVYAAVGDMYTYYLGSRYYVPQLCRFFNADKHSDTQTGVLATNMFAYCNNNPVMNVDPTGEESEPISLIKTILNILKNLIYLIKGFGRSVREFFDNGALKISLDNNSHNTASIVIDMENTINTRNFSDILLFFYEKYSEEVFVMLTKLVLDSFYDEIGREFLFSDECVKYEIQEHVYGYWWSIGEAFDASILMKAYGFFQGDMKGIVHIRCETINLAEYDVLEPMQAIAFNYYNSIRNKYYMTSQDPYWHGFYRIAVVNKNWKMN